MFIVNIIHLIWAHLRYFSTLLQPQVQGELILLLDGLFKQIYGQLWLSSTAPPTTNDSCCGTYRLIAAISRIDTAAEYCDIVDIINNYCQDNLFTMTID